MATYVETIDELRAVVGHPAQLSIAKQRDILDRHAVDFLARSPFCLLATAGADGSCDVTPRGDDPGFAVVLDERTLAVPERPGNKRLDNLSNIIANPRVGLLFVVPGTTHTLRVNGSARIAADAAYFDAMAVYGRRPLLAVEVTVAEVYFHCAKAFVRSRLWRPESWPDQAEIEGLGSILRAQVGLTDADVALVDERGTEAYRPSMF